jgi:hypothetical protein
MRRHGGQAQGGDQVDAVEGHLIDAIFHLGNAGCRRVSRGGRSPCSPAYSPASSAS